LNEERVSASLKNKEEIRRYKGRRERTITGKERERRKKEEAKGRKNHEQDETREGKQRQQDK
jgi:hypothetical protein